MVSVYHNPDADFYLEDHELMLSYRDKVLDHFFGSKSKTIAGLDTETTGPTFFNGCRPFYVSIADTADNTTDFLWRVDPFTRRVAPPPRNCYELQDIVERDTHFWVYWNKKFDDRALRSIGITPPEYLDSFDGMIASHVVNSLESHNLKDCSLKYLQISDSDEYELKAITLECISRAKTLGWNLAQANHPMFPALSKTEWWKLDMWVPGELANFLELPEDHTYRTVTKTYGMMDAIRTLGIASVYVEALEDEDLWEQYWEKYKMLSAIDRLESRGVSLHKPELLKQREDFAKEIAIQEKKIITSYSPTLKKANSSKQLSKVLYEEMKVPVYGVGKSGAGSTSKETFEKLHEEFILDPENNKLSPEAINLIDDIRYYRKLTKSQEAVVTYVNSGVEVNGAFSIFSDCNPIGTKTTRISFKSPSIQVVSKGGGWKLFAGGERPGFNLRRLFGPGPGRVWFAPDYENIELRIFGYEAEDPDLIAAFERGESVHVIFASIVYPEEYAWCLANNKDFKKEFKATLYQYVKNGNFSLIYGAGEPKADATYHKKGAYNLIRTKMPYIDSFMDNKYQEGKQTGYVRLLGGYRLRVPKTEPHKAVNYFVQGSAGWAIMRAINKIHKYLCTLHDHYLIMQIHDELVFDFPKDELLPPGHPSSLEVMRHVTQLMEESGTEIGIPLPVATDIVETDWASGRDISSQLRIAV